jgi:hypothetical protein
MEDSIYLRDNSTAYRARNLLLRNDSTGHFAKIPGDCGSGLLPEASSRGAAFGGLDNDGDVDVTVPDSE